MVLCPRCEGDELVLAQIRAKEIPIILCRECDAVWPDFVSLSATSFEYLGSKLEALGLSQSYSELDLGQEPPPYGPGEPNRS
jgi:hypothetical protein